MAIFTVEDQLYEALLNDPTVSTYLGTLGSGTARLYDTQLPQTALRTGGAPCVVFQRISTVPLYTHGSFDNSKNFIPYLGNTGKIRFQFKVLADVSAVRPPNQARQIAQAVINALANFNAWDGSSRGPNQVVNMRSGVEANTQPPTPYTMFDVLVPYADNT